ncbi:MAG TPA: FlgT C-terminal domain-containing protein [Pseudonocardiaceae bacterium]|nr:FlgT C-terminal domain-containing protein [Pseudonocardiaceae bacterium]
MSLEAKIADLLSETSLVLNVGSSRGVKQGNRVIVWEDRSISDPETGEPLGTVRVTLATAAVIEVQEKLCVAESVREKLTANRIIFGESARPMYRFTTGPTIGDGQIHVEIGQPVTVLIDEPPF